MQMPTREPLTMPANRPTHLTNGKQKEVWRDCENMVIV